MEPKQFGYIVMLTLCVAWIITLLLFALSSTHSSPRYLLFAVPAMLGARYAWGGLRRSP